MERLNIYGNVTKYSTGRKSHVEKSNNNQLPSRLSRLDFESFSIQGPDNTDENDGGACSLDKFQVTVSPLFMVSYDFVVHLHLPNLITVTILIDMKYKLKNESQTYRGFNDLPC